MSELGLTTAQDTLSGVIGRGLGRLGRNHSQALRVPDEDRQRIITNLFQEGARFRYFAWRFAALMCMSVVIAVLGLIADSTAVVIGAMLVAPLMSPILGLAAAVVMGWPVRALKQGALAGVGAAGAVALAALASAIIPGDPNPVPAEVLARTQPNLLDLGVALAAGAAGAYSQVRRQASDAITGVAVAVALVPPLAVVGITIELGQFQLATGAFFLFLANVAGITMSATITFIACGFVPPHRLLSGNAAIATGLRWVGVSVILVVLPLSMGKGRLTPADDPVETLTTAVESFLEIEAPDSELVELSVGDTESGSGTAIALVVASPDDGPAPLALADHLANTLGDKVEVNLQVLETEDSTVVAYED
ncbi:MAG: DUF389 domain-containing protein [Actinomycetia bacterium]|nr:DUF389 domain-containing protein [Actinomycetes bacterium]MCP4085531.1 DUF389 domain-containing protein [Actinomycetes bacterium]